LEKFPRTFSLHFVSVIRAGELSSKLPEAFTDLKEYLEWVEQVIADVRQASLYPMITLVVVSGFALFLFTFIIPKFIILLEGLKVPIPMLTRIIFGVSDFAKATWWVWLLALIFLVVGIPIGRRLSKRFAYRVDYIKIHLPLFGELNLMLALSRFSHNLAILYNSGIPIIQSLVLCQGLIECVPVEEAVNGVETDVKSGNTISEAMRKHRIFPAILLRMVTMGESTGTLDKSLQNVSTTTTKSFRGGSKNLHVPGAGDDVGTDLHGRRIALSIYLPLLTLMSSMGNDDDQTSEVAHPNS
jgi:type IV pilus assembly protein PilC